MATVNQADCASKRNLVKKGKFKPGKVRRLLFVPVAMGDFLSTANLATPGASLQTALHTATYKNRLFISPEITAATFTGEDQAFETIDQKKTLSDVGAWEYTFTMAASLCEYQMLRELMKSKLFNVAMFDENRNTYCIETSTGVKAFRSHEITLGNVRLGETGSTVKFTIRVALADVNEFNDLDFFVLDVDPFTLKGVEPVTLENVTPDGAADGIHSVYIKGACDSCDEANLSALYATELATASAWVSKRKSTLAALTITSVAAEVSNGVVIGHRLTHDLSDTDYVDGDDIIIQPADTVTIKGIIGIAIEAVEPLTDVAREA